MNADIVSPRRMKIAEQLEDYQGILVFANSEPTGFYRFIQNNNFLYLTGLEIPYAILVITKFSGLVQESLFIQRNIPERIVWEGEKMSKETAIQKSGITNVQYIDEFSSYISSYGPALKKLYMNLQSSQFNAPLGTAQINAKQLIEHYPQIQVGDMTDLIRPLRCVKNEWEVQQIQRAIDVTAKGISAVYENSHAGMMEYELEAMIYHKMLINGYRNWGFTPIIAAGINATTLHYIDNDTQIADNQLVLMDVGAACNNYSADITRTFPIAAKFTARQKAVYQEVLNIEKEIISMVKPGIGLPELNERTNQLIGEALVRLNLIEDPRDFRRYYMHSISHHLGMDTHDLGLRNSTLEVGNIITVEPGIYIHEENIGVRIEDDVLVTVDGYCVLSQHIPKEVEELEEIRAAALGV
ncbi:MAG TPA: Xaa-Pro aminopeptidase [Candidatus Cloacimonadota bacterium]|nr:Xaa-Pro aminopeptidase [Candidatus Cloacimonadota bacterium]